MKRLNWGVIGAVILCLAIVLLAGCGVPQSEYEALQADYQALQAELQTAQSDLASLQADYDALNVDYQTASEELAQIQEVYPPRDFSSITELDEWLLANDVSERPVTQYADAWYRKALEIQEDALKNGYIVSADYDYNATTKKYMVYCVTIINGRVFYWDPETDEVLEDSAIGTVK